MHPLFSLEGQAALVTGAGSAAGIGFAAAKLLAEMGAQVAVTATGQRIHQRAAELRKLGHTAQGYVADLTDRPATRSMIAAVAAEFGRIDILVNNAGPQLFSRQRAGVLGHRSWRPLLHLHTNIY